MSDESYWRGWADGQSQLATDLQAIRDGVIAPIEEIESLPRGPLSDPEPIFGTPPQDTMETFAVDDSTTREELIEHLIVVQAQMFWEAKRADKMKEQRDRNQREIDKLRGPLSDEPRELEWQRQSETRGSDGEGGFKPAPHLWTREELDAVIEDTFDTMGDDEDYKPAVRKNARLGAEILASALLERQEKE